MIQSAREALVPPCTSTQCQVKCPDHDNGDQVTLHQCQHEKKEGCPDDADGACAIRTGADVTVDLLHPWLHGGTVHRVLVLGRMVLPPNSRSTT